MSKSQARQHFGLVHIYWHGVDRCWDASPGYQLRQTVHKVEPDPGRSKWRDAMSEMITEHEPAQASWKDRWVDIVPTQFVARWVELDQVPSKPSLGLPADRLTREPVPMVVPRGVVLLLALLAISLTLAIIERLFRDTN